jgi:hypothetical protein
MKRVNRTYKVECRQCLNLRKTCVAEFVTISEVEAKRGFLKWKDNCRGLCLVDLYIIESEKIPVIDDQKELDFSNES